MHNQLTYEQSLLLRVKNDDQEAFSLLYQQYHPGLYAYVLKFVKLPSLAEDLVHDVFVKVWEVRKRIQPDKGFSGYLFRITRNHVYKFIQKASRDHAMRQHLYRQMEMAGGGDQLLETKEYDRIFHDALSQLPAQTRRVFILCRQEGKTYDEAAGILGISRNAIKKHMVQGMRSINQYIGQHGDLFLALYLASRIL